MLSSGTHLQLHGTRTHTRTHTIRNWRTFIYKLLKCLLRFGNPPPPRQGTVFVFISLGRLFSVEGPPRGRLAAPQHSSSLHQRPPRSAILGLSTLHKRTAAQRVRGERWEMETIEGNCEQKWDKGENEWRKGGVWDWDYTCTCVRVFTYACMHPCATHCAPACLHMFSCMHNVCFARRAAMPTILKAPSQLEQLKHWGAKKKREEEECEPFGEISWI